MMTMTRTEESTAVAITSGPTLLLAFELGERIWKLGFTTGLGQRPRVRQIPARATDRVLEEIARAKVRFHLPPDAAVVSCYEAGREAFWLHRWLVAHGATLVGSDTPGFECLPTPGVSVHAIMLVDEGIHIMENLNLEEIAPLRKARAMFVALPLRLAGSTGSPIRPIAIA